MNELRLDQKMLAILLSCFFSTNMDNLKQTGAIITFKLRQESTFSSFSKYMVFVFSILMKIDAFSEFQSTIFRDKN
jgi:hypothetical protein